MDQNKPKKKRRFSMFLYIIFWIAIIGMFSGMVVVQMSNYNEYRADLLRIQADIAREQAIYADLRLQMTMFDSDAYIERLARERLGMVHPHEIVFRNIAD